MFLEFSYLDVNTNKGYYVEFSQLNTELLLNGFESNCAQYDIRNEHGKIVMSVLPVNLLLIEGFVLLNSKSSSKWMILPRLLFIMLYIALRFVSLVIVSLLLFALPSFKKFK